MSVQIWSLFCSMFYRIRIYSVNLRIQSKYRRVRARKESKSGHSHVVLFGKYLFQVDIKLARTISIDLRTLPLLPLFLCYSGVCMSINKTKETLAQGLLSAFIFAFDQTFSNRITWKAYLLYKSMRAFQEEFFKIFRIIIWRKSWIPTYMSWDEIILNSKN